MPVPRALATALALALVLAAVAATVAAAAQARARAIAPSQTTPPAVAGAAQVGSTLTATTGSWTGDSPITYSFTWLRCNAGGGSCTGIAGATSQSYLVAAADVAATVRVSVVAINTTGAAASVSGPTAAVTSAPSAPTSSVAPAVTGTAREGQALTVSTGTWTGTGTITYTYQWKRCDTSGQNCVDASSVIGQNTITLAAADIGKTIRAVVIAATGAGAASATSAPSPTVVAVNAPTAGSLPTVSGITREGDTLTATTGTWAGSGLTFKYQWRRCDSAGQTCVDASAQITQNAVTLAAADAGKTMRVVVTATSSGGSATATSEPTAPIVRKDAPVPAAVPIVSGLAREGQTLTVAQGAWNGVGTITYSYQWQRCDTAGQSCTDASTVIAQNSISLTAADVGKTIRGRVIATNAAGATTATSAATAVVIAKDGAIPSSGNALPAGSGPFPVAQIVAPNRLVVKTAVARPSRITSRDAVMLTVRVVDAKGRPVEGAAVRATPLPGSWATGTTGVTGADGRAALELRPTAKLPLVRGSLAVFLQATKPADDALLPVTGSRVIGIRVG